MMEDLPLMLEDDRTPLRIVSLLPSATEILCALGASAEIVGISHECDFPASIRGVPVLTKPRIELGRSSRSIDTAVRAVIRDALSIYAVDAERLAALRPDVIVTQDLCAVCAVSLDDVRSAVARMAGRADVRIVSLRPTRLGDVLDDVERVAAAIGRIPEGRDVRSGDPDRTASGRRGREALRFHARAYPRGATGPGTLDRAQSRRVRLCLRH